MSALAARARFGDGDLAAGATAAAVAALAIASSLGRLGIAEVPRPKLLAAVVFVAAVSRLTIFGPPLARPFQMALMLSIAVVIAAHVATIVEVSYKGLGGLVVVVALGAVFRHRPAVALVGAFFFDASYNTLQALLDINGYRVHDAVFGGLCAAVAMSYLFGPRDRRAVPLTGVILMAVYVAVTRVYAELAANPAIGDNSWYYSAWFMLAAVAVAYGPWSPDTWRRAAKGALVVFTVIAAYAVLRWIIGPADAERDLALSDPNGAKYNLAEGKLRVFGSFATTHVLGSWCAVVLPFFTALAVEWRGRWRLLAAVGGGLAFAAMIASGLRSGIPGALLGCTLVMVLIAYTRAGRGLRLQVLAVIGVTLVAGFGVIAAISPDPATSTRSYEAILDPGSDPAYQERLYKWSQAWRDVERYPLGQGLGTAGQAAVRDQRFASIGLYDVDNSYLKIAVDQGFVGLGLFAAALVAMLLSLCRRSLATTDRQRATLGAAGAGALASYMVLIWTANYIEGPPAYTAWALVGLGLAQFATVAARNTASYASARRSAARSAEYSATRA